MVYERPDVTSRSVQTAGGWPGIRVTPLVPDANGPSMLNSAGGSLQFRTSLMKAQAASTGTFASTEQSHAHAGMLDAAAAIARAHSSGATCAVSIVSLSSSHVR